MNNAPPRSGGLPPPPKMLIRSSKNKNERSKDNKSAPPPPPPPHSVATTLPTLESAPPSANYTNYEDFAKAAASAATEQFQAAVGVLSGGVDVLAGAGVDVLSGGATFSAAASITSSNLAAASAVDRSSESSRRIASLPLPPPPIRQGAATSTFQPTVAPLPPPPPLPRINNKAPPSSTAAASAPPAPPQPKVDHSVAALPVDTNQPPPKLPSTRFRSKQLQVTAYRQTAIPVLIVATECAHKAAWKNGLLLSDLLQGLMTTVKENSTIPFRSVSRSLNISWEDLQLHFMEEMQPIPDDFAEAKLQQVAALQESDGNLNQELSLLEDKIDNLLSDDDPAENSGGGDLMDAHVAAVQKHEQVTKDAFQLTSPLNIPWLWRYRQACDDCTDFLQHDQFQCPAVILTICSTTEESNPIETVRALQLHHYLPVQFRNGMFDPQAVRHEVLVLHDNIEGAKNWDESGLRQQLQRAFGPTATVLRINSLPPDTAAVQATEEKSDLWGGGGCLGNCLTVADRARIRKYLAHFTTAAVLPALERRIVDLNVIVSDRKKGVKNVLKSFWGARGGKKEEGEAAALTDVTADSEIKYRYDSVESQVRLLADTLFLMKDYEAAYSMYRLIKEDFKQDRNWMHYASVHEMIALSLYMLDPYGRAKEIFGSVENALLSYSRAAEEAESMAKWGEKPSRVTVAPQATRLATRLCLVLTSTRNICAGRHLEVADLLASASSNETALGAAVLLEQSSAHYFKAEMYRKYAFHMLMSGHMFRAAEQEHHAFRCFTCALYIYRDGKWEELHNHLRSALAAQLYSMGRMAISLQLYAKLVGSAEGGRVSVKSQQKFVNNLLEICNDHNKKALAGADRMAAPSKLSGADRDAVRKERLDRIVQVIRYTRSASRVLELPNMDLPRVDDRSVTVLAEEAAHHRQESVPCFGEADVGSEEIWDDLMLKTVAELRASEAADYVVMNKTLAKIEDPDIRRVVALMDKEKANRSMLERNKKSATYTDSAPVRALKEPIVVQFALCNPLGLPIDLCDVQLVARMTTEDGYRMCTNEDAVAVKPLASSNEKRKWSFQSSDVEFEIADFCRVGSEREDREKVAWKSAEDGEPFFVVTKSNMTLEPESRQIASASICPLVLGDLEVVGVRSRLFDDVWVYHPFDIKGPLLQNTRSDRANRVRGESFLLKSKVERGMPCLTVDLIRPDPPPSEASGPALDGQVIKWALRISNVGTAAASNVTLKTNVPWVNVLQEQGHEDLKDTSTGDDDEGAPISFCVGPTGTLMKIPLTGSCLKTIGVIEPGEVVDVPIEIRTSGTGKQEFYMLFRYELLVDGNKEATRRCRWLKKMFRVPVYPSLTLSASLAPAFCARNEHIISVELTNCRTDRADKLELNLSRLTMASRRYRLESLPVQTCKNDASSASLDLGWQERATVHYRVVCKENEDATSLMTQCSLSSAGSVDETFSPSLLHFVCLERAHEHFEESLKQHQMALARAVAQGDGDQHPRSIASIRRANTVDVSVASSTEVSAENIVTNEKKEHPTSVARLCPVDTTDTDSFHLVCSWNGHDGSIQGNHHIRGLSVRPLASSEDCPITITASHPSSISNDFNSGPATVPIQVTLRNNRLVEAPVLDFEFAIELPDEFDFTGPECYHAALGSGEELSIPLKAILPSAGVYNLQKVLLIVDVGEPVCYRFPNQWMVTADAT